MLHLTFYPDLHFPDAVREYMPELPFKYALLGQIVRSHIKRLPDRRVVLQHGLQFAYEATGIPLEPDEIVPWRYTLLKKDNEHFVRIHTQGIFQWKGRPTAIALLVVACCGRKSISGRQDFHLPTSTAESSAIFADLR